MLTVRVGKAAGNKDFIAHESFLTSRSGFFRDAIKAEKEAECKNGSVRGSFLISRMEIFRRAITGRWKEEKIRLVSLPDENPYTFGLYLNFVYTGQIFTKRRSQAALSRLDLDAFKQHVESEYQDLFRLYVLAEKFHDVTAKNAAIMAAIDVTRMESGSGDWAAPSLVTANSIYEGTPEGSLARRLIMDMCGTLPLSYVLLQLQHRKFHPAFVSDLVRMVEKTRQFRPGYGGNVIVKNGAQAYMEEV
jgi:hypothetical protein